MDTDEMKQSVEYLTCKIHQKEYTKIIKEETKKLESNKKKLKFFNELPKLNKRNRLLYIVRNKKYVLLVVILLPVLLYLGLEGIYQFLINGSAIDVIEEIVSNVFLSIITLTVLCGGSIILFVISLMIIILLYENGRCVFLDEDLKDTLNKLQDDIRLRTKTIIETKQELEKTNQKLLNMNQNK